MYRGTRSEGASRGNAVGVMAAVGNVRGMGGLLDGRVAIVTGGGAGIGRGIVERFAAEGAAVVFAEIDPAAVAAARAKVPSLQHGRRFEVLEPMAEPTHLRAVRSPA